MSRAFRVAVAVLVVVIAGNTVAKDRVQAGKWETATTVGSGKPAVTTYCITAEEARLMNGDAATLKRYVTQSTTEKTGGRCQVKSVEVHDNQTVVTIACGKTSVTGTTTYYGDHYESSSSNGAKLRGKRIGACP